MILKSKILIGYTGPAPSISLIVTSTESQVRKVTCGIVDGVGGLSRLLSAWLTAPHFTCAAFTLTKIEALGLGGVRLFVIAWAKGSFQE